MTLLARLLVTVVLEVVSIIGLAAGTLLLAILFFGKHIQKDPMMILVLSMVVSYIGHLCVIIFHVAPEYSSNITWGVFEIFVSTCDILLWYSSLMNLSIVAASRYVATCHSSRFMKLFSKRNIYIMTTAVWLVCILVSLIPFTGFCCRKIFDLHLDLNDEEVKADNQLKNYLRLITYTSNGLVILCLIFCYVEVIRKIRLVNGKITDNSMKSTISCRNEEIRKKKTRTMAIQFLTVSIMFSILCITIFVSDVLMKNSAASLLEKIIYSLNFTVALLVLIRGNRTIRKDAVEFLKQSYICKCLK